MVGDALSTAPHAGTTPRLLQALSWNTFELLKTEAVQNLNNQRASPTKDLRQILPFPPENLFDEARGQEERFKRLMQHLHMTSCILSASFLVSLAAHRFGTALAERG